MLEVIQGIYRSALPMEREIRAFKEAGGRSVVDLTQRDRPSIKRWCSRHGLSYTKSPLPYEHGDIDAAARLVLSASRPALFHCFHGRDRTGQVARRIQMWQRGRVFLYRVGRNLNRAIRTCYSMGVREVCLVGCDDAQVGRLYSASAQIVTRYEDLPSGDGVLALDIGDYPPIESVQWDGIHSVVIGSETYGVPQDLPSQRTTIRTSYSLELTVEAALAIALQEWRR